MTEISYSGYRFRDYPTGNLAMVALRLFRRHHHRQALSLPHHKTIQALPRQGIVTALQASGPFGGSVTIYRHYGCNDRLPSERALRADGFGAQRKILGAPWTFRSARKAGD